MDAPCPCARLSKCIDLSSPPTHEPLTKDGVKHMNHPSELLLVVPVFPPIGAVMPYLYRTRTPVPWSITARNM